MADKKIPFLCGGTFFFLISGIKQGVSAREHAQGIRDEVKNEDIMDDLIFAVTGRKSMPSKSEVSLYRSCRSNGSTGIPFDDKSVRDSLSDAIIHDYFAPYRRITEFLDKYVVGEQQRNWFVKALLDIILNDEGITESSQFYIQANGVAKTKSELRDMDSFEFQPFVLGVVHFIVTNRYGQNKEGKATFDKWKTKEGNEYRYNGDAGAGIKYKITVVDCPPCERSQYKIKPEENIPSDEDERTDDEVIFENLKKPLEMLAGILEAQKHQMAETIKANNKKTDSPENESERVYSTFKRESFDILMYCIETDIAAEPVNVTLADEINSLINKWQYEVRKISNQELRKIVADTMITLSDFARYLSDKYLRYNSGSKVLIFRNSSAEEGERLREELRPESYRIRTKLAELFKRMWPAPEFDEPEAVDAEVVDGEKSSGAADTTKDAKVVHQTVVNQYGDHPVYIDHVENLKL